MGLPLNVVRVGRVWAAPTWGSCCWFGPLARTHDLDWFDRTLSRAARNVDRVRHSSQVPGHALFGAIAAGAASRRVAKRAIEPIGDCLQITMVLRWAGVVIKLLCRVQHGRVCESSSCLLRPCAKACRGNLWAQICQKTVAGSQNGTFGGIIMSLSMRPSCLPQTLVA